MEIPAYKFRGESALLECVYELNGGGGSSSSIGRGNLRARGQPESSSGQYYSARYRQQPLEYISNQEESGDTEDGGGVEEEFKYAKRKRKKYEQYRKNNEDEDLEEEEEREQEDDVDDDEEESEFEGERESNKDNYRHRLVINNSEDDFDELSPRPSLHVVNGGGFSETLYSVKWYKDNEEFYRYVPKANPPQNSYKVEGIRVDVSRLLCFLLHVSCDGAQ